jgi:thioredoxin-like negative regulator of GroEL
LADLADIEADSFDEHIKGSNVPVVFEFWIRSCDFCRKFKPVYEQLPDAFGGRVRFLRMNMMKSIENLRLAEGLGVEQTPTTKVFCGGSEVGEIVGYRTLEEAVGDISSILESSEDCGSQDSTF